MAEKFIVKDAFGRYAKYESPVLSTADEANIRTVTTAMANNFTSGVSTEEAIALLNTARLNRNTVLALLIPNLGGATIPDGIVYAPILNSVIDAKIEALQAAG